MRMEENTATKSASIASTFLQQRLPYGVLQIVVQYLEGTNGWTIEQAAEVGNLDLILFLSEKRSAVSCSHRAIDLAATNGHENLVKWLYVNRTEGCSLNAYAGCARNGHLDLLLWLLDHCCKAEGLPTAIDTSLFHATQNGHLLIVKCLLKRRDASTPPYNIFHHAARCGHIEILQYLHENSEEHAVICSTYAMDYASAYGHLQVVEWLHDNRSEGCTKAAMDLAAGNGHLDLVKWLHKHRKEECTENALLSAALGGYLEVVRWLIEDKPIEWRSNVIIDALDYARCHGHTEVSLYLSHLPETQRKKDNEVSSTQQPLMVP